MRKRLTAFILALGAVTMLLGTTSASARECIGVRGVLCVGGKHCITEPCYINP